jgi:hypothetical protein
MIVLCSSKYDSNINRKKSIFGHPIIVFSLILTIELQNKEYLGIQLLKLFIFRHQVVLVVVLLMWTPHDIGANLSALLSPSLSSLLSPSLFSPMPLLSPCVGRRPPPHLSNSPGRPHGPLAELQLACPAALARGGAPARLIGHAIPQ